MSLEAPDTPPAYVFRKHGTAMEHCTYCPKSPSEPCYDGCATIYDRIVKERTEDGVIVNDAPVSKWTRFTG